MAEAVSAAGSPAGGQGRAVTGLVDRLDQRGRPKGVVRRGNRAPATAGRGPVAVELGRPRTVEPAVAGRVADSDPSCPQCGSAEVEELSRFGSTACKALWRCLACREPFDYLKPAG